MDLESLIAVQEMFPYFEMLNGPTYVTLVKDFWVRAEIYDVDAAKDEELKAVIRDPSLRGKTRKEMGLESFRQTEIRSFVMGIPMTSTEEVIAKACRVTATGRYIWNANRNHPLLDSFKGVVLKGNSSTKLVDIDGQHRMLLKFMTECFFQKGGGSDQPSVDHKLVLYFLASFNKINLPKYLMDHLCWAINEGIKGKRKQIPYGRLLSEIFTQGKLLEIFKRNNLVSDKFLGTKTGKTLQNMKIIKKFSPREKDLKELTTPTKLMKDFPPIYQERNPKVLAKLVADSVKESGISLVAEDPEAADEVPLQVRRKRTATDAGLEASGAQTKKSRKDTSEAPATDNSSAPIPKRKRGKGEAPPVNTQERLAEAREERAKRMKAFKEKYETPGFVMTPEEAREAHKQIEEMMAERKKEKAALKAARDEKLQSIGLDGSDEYFLQKLAEVKKIADSVEQFAVKEATEMLEKIPEASEADGSVTAPESASVAEASKVIQTSYLPSIIPTYISPSSDSDLDDIPIGQRMRKLHKPSPQPQQTTHQIPLQAEQSSAVAEGTEDPEDPPTSDLPQCDSPSNLFSLERHLGGEITKTPQKATKSVPKQIDLVNQQQPKQTHQTTPKQTSTSTPTPTQTQPQNSRQKAIPEPIVETVVPKSVQVTESEQTVAITVSEPIQTLTQPPSTAITNDQPSSSSTIQTKQQTTPNLLKSEFLEAEMLAINNELQKMVQLRRSPTLKIAYQEQWVSLKNRAFELLSAVSQKCIKIHNTASMHFVSNVHLVEDRAPLYLANTPYFLESEYLTREARIFKLPRQKIVKQQEEAKAKEDLFLQKQLELEATVKMQKDLIA